MIEAGGFESSSLATCDLRLATLLTRSLAQELPTGMAAIPLNPGIIHTDMLSISFGEEAANYTPVSDWVLKAVPFILNLKPKDNGIPLTIS
ncbi:MAG: hypothetical protein V7K67_12920 [Nostoc sp.]